MDVEMEAPADDPETVVVDEDETMLADAMAGIQTHNPTACG